MIKTLVICVFMKVLELKYVEVCKKKEETSAESSETENNDKMEDDNEDEDDVEIQTKFPSFALVDSACRVFRYVYF